MYFGININKYLKYYLYLTMLLYISKTLIYGYKKI